MFSRRHYLPWFCFHIYKPLLMGIRGRQVSVVDSIDYKKAMLLFYEQNNISAFKQIFIEQFSFAVENYF